MTSGMKTIVYPVKDVAAAKSLYTALLGEPHTDQPYYVGFNVGGQEIGLDPNGHNKGMTGPVGYWHVEDVVRTVAELTEAGATEVQAPTNVGGGTLLATLADADGNIFGLIQKD